MLTYTGPKAIMTAKGEWDINNSYEALDVVFDRVSGNSYVSKIDVPAGTQLFDTTYWQLSANPSEAVTSLRTDVDGLLSDMETAKTDIEGLETDKFDKSNVIETETELLEVTKTGKVADATLVKGVYYREAKNVPYDNTDSHLESTDVQGAVDETLNVVNGIEDKVDNQFELGYLGGKNLLSKNNAVPQTINGVTFTPQIDGTVIANGTASANITYLYLDRQSKLAITNGNYIYSIGVDGSRATYFSWIGFRNTSDTEWYDNANCVDKSNLTVTQGTIYPQINLQIMSGVTVNNLVFKPMLRKADIVDDTYLPYSKSNVELTQYTNQLSNPNLLDNPWFTVNQRGVTSVVGGNYGLDRWKGIYSISNGSLVLEPSKYIIQPLELELKNNINNKICTLSIMYQDNTVDSGSFEYISKPSSAITALVNNKISCQINTEGNVTITCRSAMTSNLYIKAVKLELGTVSTLANDIAPDYGTELLKCQRYFVRIKPNANLQWIAFAQAWESKTANAIIYLPTNLKRVPTPIASGSIFISKGLSALGRSNLLSINAGYLTNNILVCNLHVNNDLDIGSMYCLKFEDTSGYIDFSADL